MRLAFAMVACLAGSMLAPAVSGVPYSAIDAVLPPTSVDRGWDDDRMRGARERLKDIISGTLR